MNPLLVFVCLLVLCGCARSISKSDAGAKPAIPDRDSVRVLALRHVMSHAGAAAYALRDLDCVGQFKGFATPVLPYSADRMATDSGAPVDRTTGLRVTILKIDSCEVDGGTAKVAIVSYSGNTGVVGWVVLLKKNGREWSIGSMKTQAIAKKKPNKSPEPTPGSVTIRAVRIPDSMTIRKARLAPAPVVAQL